MTHLQSASWLHMGGCLQSRPRAGSSSGASVKTHRQPSGSCCHSPCAHSTSASSSPKANSRSALSHVPPPPSKAMRHSIITALRAPSIDLWPTTSPRRAARVDLPHSSSATLDCIRIAGGPSPKLGSKASPGDGSATSGTAAGACCSATGGGTAAGTCCLTGGGTVTGEYCSAAGGGTACED